jgi:hypothetical protein
VEGTQPVVYKTCQDLPVLLLKHDLEAADMRVG